MKISDLVPIASRSQDDNKIEDINSFSNEAWKEGEKWTDIIIPLLDQRLTREKVNEVATKVGVHISTVYRKIASFKKIGKTSAIVPRKSSAGKGGIRLSPEVEAIVSSTIDELYVKKKASKKKTIEEIKTELETAKLKVPHQNTIRNRIRNLPDIKKSERNVGSRAAAEKNSAFPGHFPGADWPLAVIQIDHTKFDIILVDDEFHLSIGRPWITVAIDVYSRMIVGLLISLDPPNSMSVGLCISHAILMKEKWLTKRGIDKPWPCWGVMKKIHADNAGEFRGNMLRRACKEYSIDLEWRPVKKARYGAHIEALLGTFSKEVKDLPGATFSNPDERGNYDSEGEAVMTFSAFEKWLVTFITGVYHQKPHSTLLIPPVKKYERGILGSDDMPGRGLPRRINDEDRLNLDLMPYEERTIQEYGIQIDHVHYYSDVLRRYVNAKDPDNPKKKRKFLFRRSPFDISVVYFYDPEVKDYFKIPYRDTSQPPMSVWEFRAARERLIKQGKDDTDEALIFESYKEMREIEEQSVRETKSVRRRNQRRKIHSQAEKPRTAEEKNQNLTEDNKTVEPVSRPIVLPYDEIEDV